MYLFPNAYCSVRGKQIYQVPLEYVGGAEHALAICDAARTNSKVGLISYAVHGLY